MKKELFGLIHTLIRLNILYRDFSIFIPIFTFVICSRNLRFYGDVDTGFQSAGIVFMEHARLSSVKVHSG